MNKILPCLCCLSLFLSACDSDPSAERSQPLEQVGGEWRITGSGHRDFCEDESLNGVLSLNSHDALKVVQSAEEGSDENRLSLEEPVSGLSVFSGSVEGDEVWFYMEEFYQSEIVSYQFHGIYENSQIVGAFHVQGPFECFTSDSSSSFSVHIS